MYFCGRNQLFRHNLSTRQHTKAHAVKLVRDCTATQIILGASDTVGFYTNSDECATPITSTCVCRILYLMLFLLGYLDSPTVRIELQCILLFLSVLP